MTWHACLLDTPVPATLAYAITFDPGLFSSSYASSTPARVRDDGYTHVVVVVSMVTVLVAER